MLLGIVAWLATAQIMYGAINLETTAHNEAFLAGNLMSILSGGLICLLVSLARPDNFDFHLLRDSIELVEDKAAGLVPAKSRDEEEDDGEKVYLLQKMKEDDEILAQKAKEEREEDDEETLKRALKVSIIGGTVLASILVIAWPAPLVLSGYVFSKTFFYGWVALSLTWGVVAGVVITVLPWWESRDTLAKVFRKFTKKTA